MTSFESSPDLARYRIEPNDGYWDDLLPGAILVVSPYVVLLRPWDERIVAWTGVVWREHPLSPDTIQYQEALHPNGRVIGSVLNTKLAEDGSVESLELTFSVPAHGIAVVHKTYRNQEEYKKNQPENPNIVIQPPTYDDAKKILDLLGTFNPEYVEAAV